MGNSQGPTVAHLMGTYFKLSQNWIHTQVKYLNDWNPVILTHRTDNLETVSWLPEYFSRCDHLPYTVRKLDGALSRAVGAYPSHYLKAIKSDIDLLHAHFGYQGYRALHLKEKLDIPLVTTFYGYDISKLPAQSQEWRDKYKVLFEKGNLFLAEGPYLKKQISNAGCKKKKIRVNHLGVEVDNYKFEVRKRYECEPLRILMAGRFVERKGFLDGLKAFKRYLDLGGEALLTIVGDAKDTQRSEHVKRKMKKYVSSKSLSKKVVFKGFVQKKELKKEYYKHNILLSPSKTSSTSDNEGGAPVILTEAQATGLPVVSTYHCDIPEVVLDGKTGLLSEEGNIEGISNNIQNISTDSILME